MLPGKHGEMNNSLISSAYKDKRVLLTGHTGFKGSWLLLWLKELGAVVKGYALRPEHGDDLYCLLQGENFCSSVIADIREKEYLKEILQEFQPDFVFHLAAQPLVRYSYDHPRYTFDVNVTGTINVLEAVRGIEKKCVVIIVTSDKVYENKETGQTYTEEDNLGGRDPYSASKAAAEIVTGSYRASFFNPDHYDRHKKSIATVRAGNVIGGGDRSDDRIIPDIIRGIEKNQPVIVRNPDSVRPWQFVLEPLGGYLLLGALMYNKPTSYTGAWNFGPAKEDIMTVRQVVEKAIASYGRGEYVVPQLQNNVYESKLLRLDIKKANDRLHWYPKLDSSSAIELTIQWYKKVNAANAVEYSLAQLRQYFTE